MKVQTSNGFDVLIDEQDLALFMSRGWSAEKHGDTHYLFWRTHENGIKVSYRFHRVILNAAPNQLVDHKNHNGLDNRRDNLRTCTHSENTRNKKLQRNSSTGVRNVMFSKEPRTNKEKFTAQVNVDGKRHRKIFSDLHSAELWAKQKREELHGDFAYRENEDSRINKINAC